MIYLKYDGTMTKKILSLLSQHLSSRTDLKRTEYTITVRHDPNSEDDIVEISPKILVFPNVHDKQQKDKRTIVYHIMKVHFPEALVISKNSEYGDVHIHRGIMTEGTYSYCYKPNYIRRRWFRI